MSSIVRSAAIPALVLGAALVAVGCGPSHGSGHFFVASSTPSGSSGSTSPGASASSSGSSSSSTTPGTTATTTSFSISFTPQTTVTVDLAPGNANLVNATVTPGAAHVPVLQGTISAGGGDVDIHGFGLGALVQGATDAQRDVTLVEVQDANGNVVYSSTFVDGAPSGLPQGMTLAVNATTRPAPGVVAHVANGSTATFTVLLSFAPSAPSGSIQIVFDSVLALEATDASGAPCAVLAGPGLAFPVNGEFNDAFCSGAGGSSSGWITTLTNTNGPLEVFDYANPAVVIQ